MPRATTLRAVPSTTSDAVFGHNRSERSEWRSVSANPMRPDKRLRACYRLGGVGGFSPRMPAAACQTSPLAPGKRLEHPPTSRPPAPAQEVPGLNDVFLATSG